MPKTKSKPYDAQVLDRVFADQAGLLHEYEEFLQNSDNPRVKMFLQNLQRQHAKNMDDASYLHYNEPRYKALEKPYGMTPPDYDYRYEEEENPDAWMDEPANREVLDEMGYGRGGPEEEGPLGGQDFMEGLGSQLGPDMPLPMGDEQFHKALQATADFLGSLVKMSMPNPEYDLGNQDIGATDIGYGNEEELASPLQRRQKKSFSKGMQGEARRQANELQQFDQANQLGDLDSQSEINDVIRLLHSLGSSREASGSEDPLNEAEISAIDKGEKSLRSILGGRKSKWPKGDFKKPARSGRKSLDEIEISIKEQTKGIEELQQTLNVLTKML